LSSGESGAIHAGLQAIFARERSTALLGVRAYLIDHGIPLGGSTWELRDLDSQPLLDRKIYCMIETPKICELAARSLSKIRETDPL
jgi:hypothetical protein